MNGALGPPGELADDGLGGGLRLRRQRHARRAPPTTLARTRSSSSTSRDQAARLRRWARTRATSSSRRTGLARKSSAPASRPSITLLIRAGAGHQQDRQRGRLRPRAQGPDHGRPGHRRAGPCRGRARRPAAPAGSPWPPRRCRPRGPRSRCAAGRARAAGAGRPGRRRPGRSPDASPSIRSRRRAPPRRSIDRLTASSRSSRSPASTGTGRPAPDHALEVERLGVVAGEQDDARGRVAIDAPAPPGRSRTCPA